MASENGQNDINKQTELSDEELRKLLKPDPTEEQIYHVLQRRYKNNDSGDTIKIVRELDSYDDKNYLVEIGGVKYLFKIHNGVESLDLVEALEKAGGDYYKDGCSTSLIHLQNAIMELLNQHGITTSTPIHPYDSRDNSEDTKSSMPVCIEELPVVSKDSKHSPCKLVIRLLSWIPGTTMSSIQLPSPFQPYSSTNKISSLDTLADAGRYLGRIDTILDKFSDATTLDKYPSAMRFHQWDGKNVLDLKNYLCYIDGSLRQGLVLDVLNTFQLKVVSDLNVVESFRKGMNQADYNDANIIVDEETWKTNGVIDFGDSVYSWRLLDIAVAMAYGMVSCYGKSGFSVAAAASLLRGFHSVYPLLQVERDSLVLLMACRLTTSVTLGAYSYKQNPGNEYLLLHAEPAWKKLEFLWGWGDSSDDKKDQQQAIEKQRKTQAMIHKRMNQLFEKACCNVNSNDNSNNKGDDMINCSDICISDDDIVEMTDEQFEQRLK